MKKMKDIKNTIKIVKQQRRYLNLYPGDIVSIFVDGEYIVGDVKRIILTEKAQKVDIWGRNQKSYRAPLSEVTLLIKNQWIQEDA